MKDEKPDFGELEADLAELAEPVAPPPQLKSNIMDAIASGEYPQVAPGEEVGADNVVPLLSLIHI